MPLVRGLESEVVLMPPSKLAEALRRDELDAALVSVTEVMLTGRYDVLDGIAVAALGEVKSVFLAHRRPIADAREVYCDPASLTSVNLLKVLLAEQGLRPEFKALPDDASPVLPDYTLLIGDRAIAFERAPHEHAIWDLGAAWYEKTRLPFVYAVWALRRGIDVGPLCRQLREARDFGLETIETLINDYPQFDYDFRKDYLTWHIHYYLGSDEKRGLAKFAELMERHGLGPVYDVRFVCPTKF